MFRDPVFRPQRHQTDPGDVRAASIDHLAVFRGDHAVDAVEEGGVSSLVEEGTGLYLGQQRSNRLILPNYRSGREDIGILYPRSA